MLETSRWCQTINLPIPPPTRSAQHRFVVVAILQHLFLFFCTLFASALATVSRVRMCEAVFGSSQRFQIGIFRLLLVPTHSRTLPLESSRYQGVPACELCRSSPASPLHCLSAASPIAADAAPGSAIPAAAFRPLDMK